MEIKLVLKDEEEVREYNSEQFKEIMGVEYLLHLEFQNEEKVVKYVKRAEKKDLIDMRQKWLGTYYAKEIGSGFTPDLTIRWFDPKVGYGVVANRDLPKRTYIGEYTGVVRKRKFFEDQKNGYCFVYAIAEDMKTPFIIDAKEKGNYTRFINHSDTPNLEPAAVYCDGLMHIILYTIKPIAKGTQLAYDYGEEYWRKRKKIKKPIV